MSHELHVQTSSARTGEGSDVWLTPPEVFDPLNAEFGFALDAACLSGNALAPDGCAHDLGRCGLREPWVDATWCNPPYSDLKPWMAKARCHVVFAHPCPHRNIMLP